MGPPFQKPLPPLLLLPLAEEPTAMSFRGLCWGSCPLEPSEGLPLRTMLGRGEEGVEGRDEPPSAPAEERVRSFAAEERRAPWC